MSQMKLCCPKCKKGGTADVFKKAGRPIAILFECGHSLEGQEITQYVEQLHSTLNLLKEMVAILDEKVL